MEAKIVKNAQIILFVILAISNAFAMETPAPNPLRIMTFNIRCGVREKASKNLWQNRRARVIELIESLHPDIMGLQEPTIEQMNDLEKALKLSWFGANRGSSWFGLAPDEYNPIFYNNERLELLESGTFSINPCTKMEYLWDRKKYGLLPRICTWGKFKDRATQQEFFVFNTHLDHLYAEAQRHGLETILKFIDEKPANIPLIFMGDFNTEITPDLQTSTLKNFINTSTIAREKAGPEETRTGWYFEELKKIDHILVRKGTSIEVLQQQTIVEPDKDTLPSDHRPVIDDLIFGK